jgi:hypothetical protein
MQNALYHIRLGCAAGPRVPSRVSEPCTVAKTREADEKQGESRSTAQYECKEHTRRGGHNGDATPSLAELYTICGSRCDQVAEDSSWEH